MSQTKYKLPEDLKKCCISFVKGYDRRVKLYHDRRNDVLYGSASNLSKTEKNSYISDPTANKAARLEIIENMFDTRAMRAVEQAMIYIGDELKENEERQKMIDCILESCIKGRDFCFAYSQLPMHKDTFYERRRQFLYIIAKYMDFV